MLPSDIGADVPEEFFNGVYVSWHGPCSTLHYPQGMVCLSKRELGMLCVSPAPWGEPGCCALVQDAVTFLPSNNV